MNIFTRQRAVRTALPWLALLLSACGGTDTWPTGPAAIAGRTITGQVAKGPLEGAVVEVFAVNARGETVGTALGQTTTDASGNWSLTLPTGNQSLIATSSGGRYVDEADPEPDPAARRSVQLHTGDRFSALVPPAAGTIAINAFTDALLRKTRFETEGDNFFAVHANNRAFLRRAFGFDMLETLPADPIRPAANASLQARQYAMALGGVANIVNAYAIAWQQTIADFAVIDAVIDDLTDCSIDGRSVSGAVLSAVTLTRNINTEILRFRNNNLGAYGDTALLEIDFVECARSGRLPDVTAPVFSDVPASLTVAAASAQGTSVDDPALQALLAAVTASDDRDGPVTPLSDIPALLPLGVTQVTFSASDQAGNIARIVIAITVADLDIPSIAAPPDRDVTATGTLTQVDLGTPVVADNVTPAVALVVTNDAPAQGFPTGIHTVTWTVTDGVGLSAQALQTVTVRNSPPVLLAPLTDLEATEGQPFSVSLAGSFADSDSSLDFSLTGLPSGSGLGFDPVTGVLSGVPNDIDAQASPLQVTVTAMDETTAASGQFRLTVIDVNNPPSFSTSGDIVRDEDFATPAIVTVTPDPARPGDVNNVVYTLDAGSVDFAAVSIDAATGTVTISSLPDANGQGVLRITADDGAVANSTFSLDVAVTVNAVNDAPVFVLSGPVEVVPGFNGTATVSATAAAVPADESQQAVSYQIAHSVAYASIEIDSVTGVVSISNVADVADVAAIIAVTADDGQTANNLHTELLSFIVRDSDKLVFAGEPVDDQTPPISPVFPNPSVVPLSFEAAGLPPSLSLDSVNGTLNGTPTPADVNIGVFASSIIVTGSDNTVATFPLVIRVTERDTDLDGLADRLEAGHGTDPYVPDSDGDNIGDGIEVETGSDPLAPSAKVFRVTSDDDLRRISATTFASSSLSPAFILIEPGIYNEVLQLRPPCNHVTVVGGLWRQAHYPQADARTVLHAPLTVTGCDAAGLYHLSVVAANDSAFAATGANLSLGTVAFTGIDGRALHMNASNAVISNSVFDMHSDDVLFTVDDGSVLQIDESLFSNSGQSRLFAVSSDSRVELRRTESTAPLQSQPGVVVSDPVALERQRPDSAAFSPAVRFDLLATLTFRGHELPRGYRLEVRHGAETLNVYDINRGRYLIASDVELVPDAIMLFVEGQAVPFVIHSASAP